MLPISTKAEQKNLKDQHAEVAVLRASVSRAEERACKAELLASKLEDDLKEKTGEVSELNRGLNIVQSAFIAQMNRMDSCIDAISSPTAESPTTSDRATVARMDGFETSLGDLRRLVNSNPSESITVAGIPLDEFTALSSVVATQGSRLTVVETNRKGGSTERAFCVGDQIFQCYEDLMAHLQSIGIAVELGYLPDPIMLLEECQFSTGNKLP